MRYVKSKENWAHRESRKGESRKGWTVRREVLKGVEEAVGRVGEDVFGAVRLMTMECSFDNWKILEMEELQVWLSDWGDMPLVIPQLGDVEEAVLRVVESRNHVVLVVPNWNRSWKEEVLRGAGWVWRWREGEGEEMVEVCGEGRGG